MLPTDENFNIEPTWNVDLKLPPKPKDWRNDGMRVLNVGEPDKDRSPVWVVNVGGIREEDIEWHVEGARLFLESVHKHFQSNNIPPRYNREKHLVALPVVGTGKGAARESIGDIVIQLFPLLYKAAEKYKFDIALVSIRRPVFAAVELSRKKFNEAWKCLDKNLREKADDLAEIARAGNLVLFLGAGITAGAGLPVWTGLLGTLAEKAGMSETDRKALAQMDYLDQASIISILLGGTKKLTEEIANFLKIKEFSLSCSLLAGLPVHEVVTTNYDQMFEEATRVLGLNCAVLPWHPENECDRWILKLHGCTSHPEDIVLTKEHYLRYSTERSALKGVVQSLLITRHILFAGFGFSDQNLNTIVDEVRRAMQPDETNNSRKKFGTSLNLIHNSLTELLWKEDLNVVSMKEISDNASIQSAARTFEIFLDYLLAQVTTTTVFLLKPEYDAVLTENQIELRDQLQKFVENVSPKAKKAPEWKEIEKLLRNLGRNDEENFNFIARNT